METKEHWYLWHYSTEHVWTKWDESKLKYESNSIHIHETEWMWKQRNNMKDAESTWLKLNKHEWREYFGVYFFIHFFYFLPFLCSSRVLDYRINSAVPNPCKNTTIWNFNEKNLEKLFGPRGGMDLATDLDMTPVVWRFHRVRKVEIWHDGLRPNQILRGDGKKCLSNP